VATESGCVAAEHFDVLAKVASGLVQVTRHPTSCFPRVPNLAQNVPCLLLKAENLIYCAIKSNFIAARSKLYVNNH
jgi:hypothetical protein